MGGRMSFTPHFWPLTSFLCILISQQCLIMLLVILSHTIFCSDQNVVEQIYFLTRPQLLIRFDCELVGCFPSWFYICSAQCSNTYSIMHYNKAWNHWIRGGHSTSCCHITTMYRTWRIWSNIHTVEHHRVICRVISLDWASYCIGAIVPYISLLGNKHDIYNFYTRGKNNTRGIDTLEVKIIIYYSLIIVCYWWIIMGKFKHQPLQCGDRLSSSESDVCRRHILTTQVDPRTLRETIFIMVVYP